MSAPGEIDVRYVANLARLKLSEEEVALFQGQLANILHYVDRLREDTAGESANPAPTSNDLREDIARDWLTAEEALSNAPRQRDHLFIVPKVVE